MIPRIPFGCLSVALLAAFVILLPFFLADALVACLRAPHPR